MCQAFEGEQRHVISVEMRYGTYRAMLDRKKPLDDYCSTHGNYWCGCPEKREAQADPKTRAKRRKRHARARALKEAEA